MRLPLRLLAPVDPPPTKLPDLLLRRILHDDVGVTLVFPDDNKILCCLRYGLVAYLRNLNRRIAHEDAVESSGEGEVVRESDVEVLSWS